jgi:hypothetical protein
MTDIPAIVPVIDAAREMMHAPDNQQLTKSHENPVAFFVFDIFDGFFVT